MIRCLANNAAPHTWQERGYHKSRLGKHDRKEDGVAGTSMDCYQFSQVDVQVEQITKQTPEP